MKINKMYFGTMSLLGLLVVFAVLVLFKIKYYTDDLDKMLNQINTEIERKSDAINILRAEIGYLTSPNRLEYLANKHLKMHPISSKHVKRRYHYTVMASK